MQSFTPGPDSERALRDALGQFPTGVTVVTVAGEAGPMGITANSFSAVSLSPPLVLWCPAKASSRFAHFVRPSHFAIHVLAAEQFALCRQFASSQGGFADHPRTFNGDGVPVLDDALARFDCALWDSHDAGDHAVVLGRVTRAQRRDGTPLVFAQGGYGHFTTGV